MGHVDALSFGFMWVTTTRDSRSSDEVSYALLSSRKLPPDEETLPNESLYEAHRRCQGTNYARSRERYQWTIGSVQQFPYRSDGL